MDYNCWDNCDGCGKNCGTAKNCGLSNPEDDLALINTAGKNQSDILTIDNDITCVIL